MREYRKKGDHYFTLSGLPGGECVYFVDVYTSKYSFKSQLYFQIVVTCLFVWFQIDQKDDEIQRVNGRLIHFHYFFYNLI